ncbi:MAG: hydroxymethylglutaryl-CoA lyase [Pseudomonadota bacterium]
MTETAQKTVAGADRGMVTIFEMGPRDGLQNEARMIPTEDKIKLVDMLSECGFRKIETVSFVSPKWVPQMGDGADVMAGITRMPGVLYTGLTPNMKGYARAVEAGVDEVAVFGSASDGFSRSNVNCSAEEAIERMRPVVDAAKSDGIPVRGYVSCVVACPFDGPVAPNAVARVAGILMEAGCYEVSLGDTIGAGTPQTIEAMLGATIAEVGAENLAGHYHDTNGRAQENIGVSLDLGLRTFDGAVAGLGGCPYAPGSKGNVATEAVVEIAEAKGFVTGIDKTRLAEIANFARTLRSDAAAA